jgi:hypothetical protein
LGFRNPSCEAPMILEAIITDVTRMQSQNVCVAAVHQDRAIRLHNPRPDDRWVRSIGGLMPGDVVSLDCRPIPKPTPPHTEDGTWNRSTFVRRHRLTETELADLLSANAFTSVQDAFGAPWIRGSGGNAAFQPGKGARSLASILTRSVRAYPHFEGIRVDFIDAQDAWTRVPLEDLIVRQHQNQCPTCASHLSRLLANEFQGSNAVLRVGLAREFQAGGHPSACWMQVNHIFLMPAKRKHFV